MREEIANESGRWSGVMFILLLHIDCFAIAFCYHSQRRWLCDTSIHSRTTRRKTRKTELQIMLHTCPRMGHDCMLLRRGRRVRALWAT